MPDTTINARVVDPSERSEADKRKLRNIQKAARDAVLKHKLLGESVTVIREGKTVSVPAEEIIVPEVDS